MASATTLTTPEAARDAIQSGACPEGAVADGDHRFAEAPGPTELPRGLAVRGEMLAWGCHRFRRLPQGLSAESPVIDDCALFEGIAADFGGAVEAGGDTCFRNCGSLARFPTPMSVGARFSLVLRPVAWGGPNAPAARRAGGAASA